jgi:hypothetical protein
MEDVLYLKACLFAPLPSPLLYPILIQLGIPLHPLTLSFLSTSDFLLILSLSSSL